MSSKEKSFQDYFPGNSCYGCGPANKYGMHVTKSDWVTSEHRETMCNWKIKKKYSSAVAGLHGGTSASLVDCHSVWTAIAARYDLEESRKCILFTELVAKGIICVTAKVIAVRVELSEEVVHGLLNPPKK